MAETALHRDDCCVGWLLVFLAAMVYHTEVQINCHNVPRKHQFSLQSIVDREQSERGRPDVFW